MATNLSQQILTRHKRSLTGTLRLAQPHSPALGIRKPFYVYEPPDLAGMTKIPLLWLFRGHQREWVNMDEDPSRKQTNAIEDLDREIAQGRLPPMVAVLPGLTSTDNHIPGLGVDMAGTWAKSRRGLGTGRFWSFLTEDLIPHIEARYPQCAGGLRLASGFSLGGYTVSLLSLHLPGYLDAAGMYDATFMWPDHHDPRDGGKPDRIWLAGGMFDAALGKPRDQGALARFNPTDTLAGADDALAQALRKTLFCIQVAPQDGNAGNPDRGRYFVELLRAKDQRVAWPDPILNPDAAHNWHWNDRFLQLFLHQIFNT